MPGMTIAVASGKGGTGKTTVSTNLAWHLAETGQTVRYLDCDVEEPNGHLFLKPEIEDIQEVTVPVPRVDLKACIGCGKCGELCRYNAIVAVKTNVLTFDNLCHSCGGCMHICPVKAITEVPWPVGIMETGKTGNIRFAHGRLNIGSVRTPSLIKEVKRDLDPDAINIIDAPPGTSCPVIEAVDGVDFVLLVAEPTPFGLHDLKLATEMVIELDIPFAIAVNQSQSNDNIVSQWCRDTGYSIAVQIPSDRRIAEAYSAGQLILETLPEYRPLYDTLAERILQ
jgi:MinD superfamily P-loop ATPase